jgi:hypothetical protein
VCRRIDAAAANRSNLTREELELIDVSAEMEQQLLQHYTQVGAPAAAKLLLSALQRSVRQPQHCTSSSACR